MSREYKFRAWLKKEKKMVEVEEINFIYEEIRFKDYKTPFTKPIERNVSFKDIELLQYTNRKDKNDVEIYESAIVECEGEICTVVWDDYYSTYALYCKEFGYDNLGDFESKYLEVIGNIYENPELLGGQR